MTLKPLAAILVSLACMSLAPAAALAGPVAASSTAPVGGTTQSATADLAAATPITEVGCNPNTDPTCEGWPEPPPCPGCPGDPKPQPCGEDGKLFGTRACNLPLNSAGDPPLPSTQPTREAVTRR